MSDSQHDLEELRRLLAEHPEQRQKLLAGLGDALDARGATDTGPRAEMLDKPAGAMEKLLATGAILYAPPAIAARVLLGQTGSPPPQSMILLLTFV